METKKTSNTTAQEKVKIRVPEKDRKVFNGDIKTSIMSSTEMADIVYGLFKAAMPDFCGCKLFVNYGQDPIIAKEMNYGKIYVNLYFKDIYEYNPKNVPEYPNKRSEDYTQEDEELVKKIEFIKAENRRDYLCKSVMSRVKAAEVNKGASLASRYMNIAGKGASTGRAYDVTKHTYEMLSDFMTTGDRTNWAIHTSEVNTPMSLYGKDEVVVEIKGLDLDKIVTEIYGSKTEEDRYQYQCTPSVSYSNDGDHFLIQVVQLSLNTVTKLNNALGVRTYNNTVQFYTR